jgi:hypothetical protein
MAFVEGRTKSASIPAPRTRKSSLFGGKVRAVSPCFTPGTLIATDRGLKPIETLKRGDRLVTRDNGLKRVTWIGSRSFTYHDLDAAEALRPILIRAGAFGDGYPMRDMIVSPEHRFLITGRVAGGGAERLVAAKYLLDQDGVQPASMLGVSYLHVLLNAHEVILANGAWTESFHPDDRVMRDIAPAQRQEILVLFPEIATMGAASRFPAARPVKKSRFDG